MSAILSADDLNDFISPGVACIKPVETLPQPAEQSNSYEVTTEEKAQAENPPPASISLTDCLACSGCVTSAEAVLISLQSHTEVLTTLDAHEPLDVPKLLSGSTNGPRSESPDAKLFVASVSPQARASLAATFRISEREAGYTIEQLLSGPRGLRSGGQRGSGFTYVVDTNRMREACLVLGADEVAHSLTGAKPTVRPILTSACPGWICYAEKTHPHVLPHLSKLKSPQALTGTLLKSVLSKSLGIQPSQIWHLAIMPCFDKKLEASREELTDRWWAHGHNIDESTRPVRDVDCVITSRELLTLANDRGTNLESLPRTPLPKDCRVPFPNPTVSRFLFPKPWRRNTRRRDPAQSTAAGTSGGYLHHVLASQQYFHRGSTIHTQRGRNADIVEYTLLSASQEPLLKCARFYGFRNIQNLVRKLKPARASRMPGAATARRGGKDGAIGGGGGAGEYAYVEVMACPGGCTNGGGQIRLDEAVILQKALKRREEKEREDDLDNTGNAVSSQREWLKRVDSAYFSASSSSSLSTSDSENDVTPEQIDVLDGDTEDTDMQDLDFERSRSNSCASSDPTTINNSSTIAGPSHTQIHDLLTHWSEYTSTPLQKLAYTTFRKVESDVGRKTKKGTGPGDAERIAALAGSIGGGW
jgi:iron only hydrogenase large subunit-like protein